MLTRCPAHSLSSFLSKPLLPLLLVPFLLSAASAQKPVPEGYTAGTPWVGPHGVRVRMTEIMDDEDSQKREHRPKHIHLHPAVAFPNPQGNPLSPDVASWPPLAPGENPIPPLSPQATTINFTGATLTDTRAYPPDSMGAAGPAHFIVAVKGRVRNLY